VDALRDQLGPWFDARFGTAWNARILALQDLLRRGMRSRR